jgi:peroxiredoxin
MPAPVAAQFPPSGFTVGEPFPDLAFPAVDGGRPMSMADFRGKRVILHIFASW